MTRLVLDAGTDTAQLALFDRDALGPKTPARNEIATLEAQRRLVSIETGADGHYRVSLYVDEPVAAELAPYCTPDVATKAVLTLRHGRLGFGGVESAHAAFKPNPLIRADATLDSGDYDVTWYEPDYPESVTDFEQAGLDDDERRVLHATAPWRITAWIGVVAFFSAAAFLHRRWLGLVALALIIADAIGTRLYRAQPRVAEIRKRAEEGQRKLDDDYPGLIAVLRKRP